MSSVMGYRRKRFAEAEASQIPCYKILDRERERLVLVHFTWVGVLSSFYCSSSPFWSGRSLSLSLAG